MTGGVEDIMEDEAKNPKQIEKYSEAYRKKKLSLLGHVTRADNSDPMRQVAMESGKIKGRKVGKRRVGKPKLDWVHEGKQSAWKTFRNEIDESARRHPNRRRKYTAKLEQDMQILAWAIDKRF